MKNKVKPGSQIIVGIILWVISFSDIVSDFLVAHEYKQNLTVRHGDHNKLNATQGNQYAFLNVQMQWCNEELHECHFNSPWYFAMTLIFIFVPSVDVISSIFGPLLTAYIGIMWSIIMSATFIFTWYYLPNTYHTSWTLFIILLPPFIFLVSLSKLKYDNLMGRVN